MTEHRFPTAGGSTDGVRPRRFRPPTEPLRVMVDMDGVLADFVASCATVFRRLFPDNHRIDPWIRSYSFWADDWGISDGQRLIDRHCYEVFARAPTIDPVVWLVGQLDPRLFRAEIVTHLWGGDDVRLQEICLAAKKDWLARRGLDGLPIHPVRGVESVKTGAYDIVFEDSPSVLLNTARLGHAGTLRILIHRGWQTLPDPDRWPALNLVVVQPHNYWLLRWVIVSYWILGWSTSHIQAILDRRTASVVDGVHYRAAS